MVRILAVLGLALALAACNTGKRTSEAVRQGVIDYLAQKGLNVQGMDVTIAKMDIQGNQADATVAIAPKGNPGQGMSMQYHLEQRNSKWTVTGRKDTKASPHGAGAMAPGMENPHGGAMPPATAAPASKMPAPEDLPPANK